MYRICYAVVAIVVLGAIVASGAGVLDGVTVAVYTEDAESPELENTLEILDLEDANIVEIDTSDEVEVQAALVEADVFLIPDLDIWASDSEAIGEKLASVLEGFLTTGGRIVGCYYDAATILRAAELVAFSDTAIAIGPLVVVDDSHPITTTPFAISASFSSVDDDNCLLGIEADAEILVEDDYGDPVALFLEHAPGSIVFLGFDYYEYNSDVKNLLLNACSYQRNKHAECSVSVAIEGELEAGTTSYEDQQCLRVPRVASMVGVALEGTVNLYLRFGQEVGRSLESIDYSLMATGKQEMVISGSAIDSGYLFLAMANPTNTVQSYSLSIVPIPELVEVIGEPAEDGSTMEYSDASTVLEPPVTLLRDILRTDDGRMLAVRQYVVEVGSEVEAITVRVTGDTHANVYLRYGQPVTVDDHAVVADVGGSTESGGAATLSLGGALLQTGTYYIGVETEVGQEYEIEVVIRCGRCR